MDSTDQIGNSESIVQSDLREVASGPALARPISGHHRCSQKILDSLRDFPQIRLVLTRGT